jgi:acyl dehydratase
MRVIVGESRTLVLTEDLSRTQIVQYAGASGDYNPLHTDERFATKVGGFPSVFAHGMLTMGMTGRVLTEWFGPTGLRSFRALFVAQVWPGDGLSATATVVALGVDGDHQTADLKVVTINHRGDVVLEGNATAVVGDSRIQ